MPRLAIRLFFYSLLFSSTVGSTELLARANQFQAVHITIHVFECMCDRSDMIAIRSSVSIKFTFRYGVLHLGSYWKKIIEILDGP